MKIVRSILGVIAGIVIATIVMVGLQLVNTALHPPAAGLDLTKPDHLKIFITSLPASAFIGVLVSYLLGIFFGSFAAARIAGSNEILIGLVISLFYTAGGILNFVMIPHPIWVVVGSFIIYFAAGYFGASFARSLRQARASNKVEAE